MRQFVLICLAVISSLTTALAQADGWLARRTAYSVLMQGHSPRIEESAVTVRMIRRDIDGPGPTGTPQKMLARFGGVSACQVSVEEWLRLRDSSDPSSIWLDKGFEPSEGTPVDLAHAVELHRGLLNGSPLLGRNVLLAIYDSGIDWRHEAFRVGNDSTSIALIWDLTESPSETYAPPFGQVRGRLYNCTMLNEALQGLRSTITTTDRTGHGTAVASIAHAMAPGANLVIIKGGDDRFSEAGLIEALSFLDSLGAAWSMPVVLNLSFGSQRGPHDGTQITEQAIDAFVSRPGRFVVAAAGNDGGRGIHAEGHPHGFDDSTVVMINVPPYSPNAGVSNDGLDMEVWFADTARFSVTVETPAGRRILCDRPGMSFDAGSEGVIVIDRPSAGRVVTVQLSDAAGTAPSPGSYRLIVRSVSSFHAWMTGSRFGAQTARFTADDAVVTERYTVQSPATASGALAVGATEVISGTFRDAAWSSVGPRIDGSAKPELRAPGAFWMPSLHRHVSGTSISVPVVTGVVALLFELRPEASATDLRLALANGTSGHLDAAGAVASLLGRTAFASSFIELDRPSSNLISWKGDRLSHVVQLKLVDHTGFAPLGSWAVSGQTAGRLFLSAEQAARLSEGTVMLQAVDTFGRAIAFDVPESTQSITGVAERIPSGQFLRVGAFPNPFNASTILTLDVPTDGDLEVVVYSVDGREIAQLFHDSVRSGLVRLPWSANVASGVYFVRAAYQPAEGTGVVTTMRLALLR